MFKKNKPLSQKDKIRTEMQYRRAKANLDVYIKRCQKLANEYLAKGKQAAKVSNTSMMRQFAIGYKTMTEKRLAAEKILLSMESMNLTTDQSDLSAHFLEYAQMFEGTSKAAKIKPKDYENMLENIARTDTNLNSIIDAINDRILLTDESDLDEIMDEMDEKEDEVDKKLDAILEMMKEEKKSKSKKEKESEEQKKLRELLELLEKRKKGGSKKKKDAILDEIQEKMKEIEKHIGNEKK